MTIIEKILLAVLLCAIVAITTVVIVGYAVAEFV